MEMKHTPGPWVCKPGSFFDGSGLTFEVVAQNGADICKLPTSFNLHRIERPDRILPQHANMRLIAAAPDLLAACHMLLRMIEDPAEGAVGMAREIRDIEAARAALLLARGETP